MIVPTVEAASRIRIQNVWYLLLYAWDLAAWAGRFESGVEEAPSLLGLLTRVLAASTRDLIRRQLGRSYAGRAETIPGVRGRVDFATSVKRRTFDRAAAHCTFPELSINTPKNQIIRTTLFHLASDGRLKHAKPQHEVCLRHDLRQLVQAMEGVKIIQLTPAAFASVQLSGNDRAYA